MLNSPITANIKTQADLTNHYRGYLRALNTRTFDLVGRYIAKRARHNGQLISHTEYCSLIPQGATYTPEDIVADIQGRTIAARLSVEYPANTTHNTVLAHSYGGGHHHHSSSSASSANLEALATCGNCASGSASSNPPTPPHSSSPAAGGRSPKVCQIDEMVFYHFDEDWRIVEVNSMIQPRRDVAKEKERERTSVSHHERAASRGFGHARSRSP